MRFATVAALAPSRFVPVPAPFDVARAAAQIRAACRDLAAMGLPSDASLLVSLAPRRHRVALLAALAGAASRG